jgi:hypothetical protein
MRYVMRWLGMGLLLAAPALAQYSLATYFNYSSDGTNIYGTGEVEYEPEPGCTMCTTATHDYDVQVQIVDTFGNPSTCDSGNQEDSATQPITVECQTQMPINGQTGTFTGNFKPYTKCTLLGTLFNMVISTPIVVGVSFTGYTNGTPVGLGSCIYNSTACLPGSVPKCTSGLGIMEFQGCAAFAAQYYDTITVGSSPPLCYPMGLMFHVGGAVKCY